MKEEVFPFESDFEHDDSSIDFMTTKEMDSDEGEILYIDFKYDNEDNYEEISMDTHNQWSVIPLDRSLPGGYPSFINPGVFKKKIELVEDYISDEEVLKDFIEKSIGLSEINLEKDRTLYEKFHFKYDNSEDDNVNTRRLTSKINTASSLVATSGRIGPGRCIFISEENYNKYGLNNIFKLKKESIENGWDYIYDIIFCNIDDIIVFRCNNIDQPGLIHLENKISNKYEIVPIGFYPEKQFIKIKLD